MHATQANQPVPAIPERVFLWRHRCADLCLLPFHMTTKTCTKYGSRQPDGSVRPFRPIGYLSSSVRTNFAYREK